MYARFNKIRTNQHYCFPKKFKAEVLLKVKLCLTFYEISLIDLCAWLM